MTIRRECFIGAARNALEESLKRLPDDMFKALESAAKRENRSHSRQALEIILENIRRASKKDLPICQDTGFPGFLLDVGLDAPLDFDIYEALRMASERLTREMPLIPHAAHPLTWENPGTNVGLSCPVVHVTLVPDSDEVLLTAKPLSAIEAKCAMKVFDITGAQIEKDRFILETVSSAGSACPPLVVGIGLGSSLDNVGLLALKATMRPVGTRNPDQHIAALEQRWFRMINEMGMGCMNLGGDITALAVHIEGGFTHDAYVIVAVRCECWCNRKKTLKIGSDGSLTSLGGEG